MKNDRIHEYTMETVDALSIRVTPNMGSNSIRSIYKDILTELLSEFRYNIRAELYGGVNHKGIDDIIKDVCLEYEVSYDKMVSRSRRSNIVQARHVCMWLIRNKIVNNKLSLNDIGELLLRDHTSVMHGVKSIDNYIFSDSNFRHRLMIQCNRLGSRVEWNGKKLVNLSAL